MTKENHYDSFEILQEDEIIKLEDEALNDIRFGNDSLDKQFKRDIELISLAIVEYGHSEQDKIKAEMLLKSMLLLFFGKIRYRHQTDLCFYPFDTLNSYFKNNTTLNQFPIAAILLHGSRALIEFPVEIAHKIMDWLISDKNSWRYMATHGIGALTEAEMIHTDPKENNPNHKIYKHLKEEKMNGTQAAFNLATDSITSLMMACSEFSTPTPIQAKLPEHYGIDLALGGAGNQHFASKKIIQNNGEHGHLYINFYRGEAQHSGLLLGIEQSSPGKPDQYGGQHDLRVSDKSYSASGGDFFGKKPILPEIYQKDYQGLSVLPFADYYDSLWNDITEDTFVLIKTNFEKCKALMSLLSKEKILLFIKHILSSSGGANQQDFDQLFDCYFEEIPQVKIKKNQQASIIEQFQIRHEQLQALYYEKQQAEVKVLPQLISLEQQVHSAEYEKEWNKQEAKKTVTQLQQQLLDVQMEKNTLLFNLAKCFMQGVIQQMGWRASNSQKQMIMLGLQQFDSEEIKLNNDHIKNLLKNFIGVSLMNRYGFNHGETHSASMCLHCLKLPQYQPLITLLFKKPPINYNDLLSLIVGDEIENKKIFTSARYIKNLYRFYQEKHSSKNKIDESKLLLATQQLVYTV